MNTLDRRAHKRVSCEVPALLAAEHSESYRESRLRNFSGDGIYFETAEPFLPDSMVRIRVTGDSPGGNGPEAFQWYLANIRWRQSIEEKDQVLFGFGAKIMQRSNKSLENVSWASILDRDLRDDRHPRFDRRINSDFVVFCDDGDDGDDHLAGEPDGPVKQSLIRFLNGNVL
ncbi:MAG: PilZ domain-containing protein [Desulfococcaceae bacterium]